VNDALPKGAEQVTAPFEFSWDMSITRAEFERGLADAVGHAPYVGAGNVFSCALGARAWRIELDPLPDRAIALLRLPRHRVSFCLEGYTVEEREAWIARFRRYFQRGGG
jgi:hypothetical protein